MLTDSEKLYLKAKQCYYDGEPIMTDEVFDELEKNLKKSNSQVINLVGSLITDKIKIPHISPMLSLEKISSKDDSNPPSQEILEWCQSLSSSNLYEVTPKFDGSAVNLIYKNGELYKALTRGDGTLGHDITDKMSYIIPIKIPEKDTIEIRGEALIKINIFDKYYSEYKNPRNLVAGFLGSKETKKSDILNISFVPHEFKYHKDNGISYSSNICESTKNLGFEKPYTIWSPLKSKSAIEDIYKQMLDYRNNYCPYQLDGFVIKTLNMNVRKEVGETDHHPRWSIAIKFKPKITVTEVLDIEWNLGKTGELTPVAILEPIDLDGSTISRCSLYNYGNLIKNEIYPNSIVSIEKGGDIIPKITEVVVPLGDEIDIPKICPNCGQDLSIIDKIHLMCTNENCSGMNLKKFINSLSPLKLDGWGPKILEKLYNVIQDPSDIFDKTKFNKEILIKSGFFKKGKSLDNLFKSLESIKEIEIWKCVILTGMNDIGKSTSIEISKMLEGIDYDDYGLQKNLFDEFKKDENIDLFNKILNKIETFGIEIIKNVVKTNMLTYEMTGSPKPYFNTKSEFEKFMEQNNYINESLSSNTNILVCDDINSNSAKMQKAKKLGIEIVTYKHIKESF